MKHRLALLAALAAALIGSLGCEVERTTVIEDKPDVVINPPDVKHETTIVNPPK